MPRNRPLPKRTEEMVRVDHAGEYAAVAIYQGQRAVFEKLHGKSRIVEQLTEMEAEEQHHLAAFDDLIQTKGVRPTAMTPIWGVAAYGLGVATALLGEKAAHACTEAVETVIEKHYDDQVKELEAEGETELSPMFAQFRDEEAAHKDLAVEEGAHEAPAYPLLSAFIKAGCRAAIKISEKV
ncbi:demethoxyubiquinone hydroxylase family protein [Hirschia baltica]|uniref:3-demethoxyubiquinol 3-hydroxylase n=1 Tax=Hirschia baltica (strain ATCC 49814 / DSM 5838 / IFAM 1418) TaxID=582402 RepID=C6XLU2_HIRBI|nr:demethoxyubiquinone hydroxylase family protein [Hirschia baltica]ACT57998.1 Ubiquinone biosynthesis protein COQ7 [Hirschia baltica ATCC 49814]